MMARRSPLRIVATAIAVVAAALVLGTWVGCIGGNCSSAHPGIVVVFPKGVTSSDVAAVTVTCNACGPVPSPLCAPGWTYCDPNGQKQHGWEAYIPCARTGDCPIHVALTDGETVDDTVKVKHYTDCGDGYYGDHPVEIAPPSSTDGGSVD